MLSKNYFTFFKQLEKNNNKEWFDKNRNTYETEVKEPFKKLVEAVAAIISAKDERIDISAGDMIFRINRDIRFSKNKTPYKTHMAALISARGRKNHTHPGYYMHVEAGKISLGGGAYFLEPADLKKVRQEIVYSATEFKKILNDAAFKKTFGSIDGEKSKIVPKEFADDVKAQPLILNKQFYFWKDFPIAMAQQKDAPAQMAKAMLAGKKLNDFLRKALS